MTNFNDIIESYHRGSLDFEHFVTKILGKEYYPQFNSWFNDAIDGKAVVGSRRQSGRTTFFTYFIMHKLLYSVPSQPCSIVYVTTPKASMTFKDLVLYANNMPEQFRLKLDVIRSQITTSNGSKVIIIEPSEVRRLQGRTLDTWILDNAELYTVDDWTALYGAYVPVKQYIKHTLTTI